MEKELIVRLIRDKEHGTWDQRHLLAAVPGIDGSTGMKIPATSARKFLANNSRL
jgi:hypothetical protein